MCWPKIGRQVQSQYGLWLLWSKLDTVEQGWPWSMTELYTVQLTCIKNIILRTDVFIFTISPAQIQVYYFKKSQQPFSTEKPP